MGNLNCTRCCQGAEIKQEFDLKSSVNPTQITLYSHIRETQCSEQTQNLQKEILSIQSLWRRFLSYKEYKKLKANSELSQYFPKVDVYETLTAKIPERVQIMTYEYKTRCVYTGEWFGGFRHGFGECRWPDGCLYKGEWKWGFPFGKGTFVYFDNETYDGNWINPYANSKNRSILEDVVLGKRDGFGNF